jgi:hypothetical protein
VALPAIAGIDFESISLPEFTPALSFEVTEGSWKRRDPVVWL